MEFYRQTSQYTGAAAALLMSLHERRQVPLIRDEEFRIWIQSANLPTRSSSIYALARIAKEKGAKARVVVGEKAFEYPDYRFKRYKKLEIQDASFSSELHLKEAEGSGIEIEEREFDLSEVKELVKQDKHVLLRLNAGELREQKATSRYVLVTGHDGGSWKVMDPQQGEQRVDDAEMKQAFDTLETKKKRDHRMLIIG